MLYRVQTRIQMRRWSATTSERLAELCEPNIRVESAKRKTTQAEKTSRYVIALTKA